MQDNRATPFDARSQLLPRNLGAAFVVRARVGWLRVLTNPLQIAPDFVELDNAEQGD